MPKLKGITPKNLLRLLTRAGFVIKRQKGSHVILKHPTSGRRVILAMHPRAIPKGTLHNILKESGLR